MLGVLTKIKILIFDRGWGTDQNQMPFSGPVLGACELLCQAQEVNRLCLFQTPTEGRLSHTEGTEMGQSPAPRSLAFLQFAGEPLPPLPGVHFTRTHLPLQLAQLL